MKIIRSPRKMQALALRWRRRGRSVGLVPTMGALHEGHLSLIRRARRENRIVVVSVFVNPSQFGPKEDFARYPRPFAKDAALCRRAGVDALFAPAPPAMYPPGFQTWISVEKLSRFLCGPFRPGHFRGVATVVAKLLQIVLPDRAYFGQKDFQQLRVVERLVADLNFPVRIVGCPTVRERDGLALSSRNRYLTQARRRLAARIPSALQAAGELVKFRTSVPAARVQGVVRAALRRIPGARVDYVSVADPDTLEPLRRVRGRALVATAVRLGRTRLIDNRTVSAGTGKRR